MYDNYFQCSCLPADLGSTAMQNLDDIQLTAEIATSLKESKTIAIVGLSPKEARPSNMVGKYLIKHGYTVYPVNPGQESILGEKCYKDISDVPSAIDIVDIFRKSEDILPIVEKVLTLHSLPKVIWMQQGIVNQEAAELAKNAGIFVIMDRCIKVDHTNYVLPGV